MLLRAVAVGLNRCGGVADLAARGGRQSPVLFACMLTTAVPACVRALIDDRVERTASAAGATAKGQRGGGRVGGWLRTHRLLGEQHRRNRRV